MCRHKKHIAKLNFLATFYAIGYKRVILVQSLLFLVNFSAHSQGPSLSYYYNPNTELSWASSHIFFEGGSKQRISFLPVINYTTRAPMGTYGYSKNIELFGNIVFVSNGISMETGFDCYENLDVSNKVVMFYYDFPEKVNDSSVIKSFDDRILDAILHGASGIIAASYKTPAPIKYFKKYPVIRREVPVIVVNRNTADAILEAAGSFYKDSVEQWKTAGKLPELNEHAKMPIGINLQMVGEFDVLTSKYFAIRFHGEILNKDRIVPLVELGDKSVAFLLKLFNGIDLKWEKEHIVYFANYDSKLFYTGHWGMGLSSEAGIFNVRLNGNKEKDHFGLIVHENAHSLFNNNLGGTNSFLNEGVARYAEAKATNPEMNNLETIAFLKSRKLYRLERLLNIEIGESTEQSEIAYPASGSFVEFLLETYGIVKLKQAWTSNFSKVYKMGTFELEKEWLLWLRKKYHLEGDIIKGHLNKNN